MLNSYKEFSQIYDLLMDDIDYHKWKSFIVKRTGCNKKILEAACGTGSVTRLLAESDCKVTAFDLSQDMLMIAYEKLGRSPGVKLLNMDMASFKIDDGFDASVCCCDGINYITLAQVREYFKNVFNHLNDDSWFIFDMSTEHKYHSMFNDTYVYDDGDIFYVWENIMDEQNNAVNMEINFFVKDAGDKYTMINEIQTQYIHKTKDIENILRETGFCDIEVFDYYSEKLVHDQSQRAVFTARKK